MHTRKAHTCTVIIARFIEPRSRENLCTGSASFTLELNRRSHARSRLGVSSREERRTITAATHEGVDNSVAERSSPIFGINNSLGRILSLICDAWLGPVIDRLLRNGIGWKRFTPVFMDVGPLENAIKWREVVEENL